MAIRQIATRVDEEQYELFRETTQDLGTTPADALRMFVYAFNRYHGFPYSVRLPQKDAEPFATEEEATEFATRLALRTLHEEG